jgi:DNA helicase HerA-like ATPase
LKVHSLVTGITGTGKTRFVRAAIPYFKRGVIVFDPFGMPKDYWGIEHVYSDPSDFINAVKEARHCHVIVDEAPQLLQRGDPTYQWLATQGRHLGHLCHFLTQRPSMLPPTVRGQCSHVVAFRLSFTDAKLLADERACMGLLEAPELALGEYLYAAPDGTVTRGELK